MRIKYIAIFIVICLVFSANAFAASVVMDSDRTIRVEGKTNDGGKTVNILVINPGATPQQAETDLKVRQYIGEVVSDANGNYRKVIGLNTSSIDISGDFQIYLSENDFQTPEKYTVFVATLTETISSANLLVTCSDEDFVANFIAKKRALALDIDIINAVDFSSISTSIMSSLINNPIQFDMGNIESVSNIESLHTLQTRIKELAIIELYNQNKSDILFGENNKILYDDLIGFSKMDNDNNTTIYKMYNENLSLSGKQLVNSYLLGKNVLSFAQLKILFADAVMFYGIKYNTTGGYGHISNYITLNNVMFAEITSEAGVSVPTYLGLNDKSYVNSTMLRQFDTLSIVNYKAKLEYYAKNYPTDNTTAVINNSSTKPNGTSKIMISPNAIPLIEEKTGDDNPLFDDLQDSLWANEAIVFLNTKGIIKGVADKKFSPSDGLTREQAAKIICLAFKIGASVKTKGFMDVEAGGWYSPYISDAASAGVLNGISDTMFGVGQSITRQDLAVMIYRALGTQQESNVVGFSDVGEISSYAKEAVNYLNGLGIISGYEDGSFRPNNFITRAEAAQLFYGVLKKGE